MSKDNKCIDIAKYASTVTNTSDLVILDPETGEESETVITLYSIDSDAYQKKLMQLRKENVRYRDRKDGVPQEKLRSDSTKLYAACTVAWKGLIEDGNPIEFNPENVRRVYESMPFIREQVIAFVEDRSNFIKA